MAGRDIDLLARRLVALERQQSATSRATQLTLSSVRLLDGSSVAISGGLEGAEGNTEDLGILNDYTNDIAGSLDEAIDFNDNVYDWIGSSAEAGEIAWDATEYAVDLANQLEEDLTAANAVLDQARQDLDAAELELEQAQIDLTQALTDSATALQEAHEARQEAGYALASADGKSTNWYQNDAPAGTAHKVGDTWFKLNDGNRVHRWDGSDWVTTQFGTNAISDTAINAAKLAANAVTEGKILNGAITNDKLNPAVQNAITTAQSTADNAQTIAEELGDTVTSVSLGLNGLKLTATNLIDSPLLDRRGPDSGDANQGWRYNPGGDGGSFITLGANTALLVGADLLVDPPVFYPEKVDLYTRLGINGGFHSVGAGATIEVRVVAGLNGTTGRVSVWSAAPTPNIPPSVRVGVAELSTAGDTVLRYTNTRSYAHNAYIRLEIDTTSGDFYHYAMIQSVSATDITEQLALEAQLDTLEVVADGAATAASAAASAASAAQTAANNAQTTADGKNKIVRSGTDASSPGDYVAGDQWWKYSGSQITAMWIHSGSAWVSQTLTDSVITNLNAGSITAGTISADRLSATNIKAVLINAGAIETANIAAGAITAASGIIADLAIGTAKIIDGSITTAKIEDLAVTNAEIANGTIQNAKIANLDAAKITTGYLNADRIEALSITAQKLGVDSVTSDKIVAGAVVAGKLAANSVVAENIVGGTITGDKLVGLTITGDKIAANAITAGKISADAIDGKTITGATVRTSPSGQRIQFDTEGVRGFDANDNEAFSLKSSGTGFRFGLQHNAGLSVISDSTGSYLELTGDRGALVGLLAHGSTGGTVTLDGTGGALTLNAGGSHRNPSITVGGGKTFELRTPTTAPGNTFEFRSQLDAWAPIDGTHAWVTSEGREYVRAGGQWKVAFETPDITNLTRSAGVNGTVQATRIGNTVEIAVNVSRTSAFGIGHFAIATIPASLNPSGRRAGRAWYSGGTYMDLVAVAGTVYIAQDTSTPANTAQGSLVYMI